MIVGVGLMVRGMFAKPTAPLGSVTENAGVKLPEAVGVPPKTPPEPIDIPAGNPVADHCGVPESPLALRVVFGYGWLMVEAGRLFVVIWGAMLRLKLCEFVNAGIELSATRTVKFDTVAVVAVPEITPFPASPIPGGNCPAVRVHE